MPSFPPLSNEESWASVIQDNGKYPDTPYWNEWRSVIDPLIDEAVKAGYNKLFRAEKSMHHILFSVLDHHGLRDEPRVTLSVTEDWKIQVHYSVANIYFRSALQCQTVIPTEAFPVLTRYLQHLWTETVAEPIPETLRARIPKEIQ
jgi:hypothetical protein